VKKFYHATHRDNVAAVLSGGLTLPVGRPTSGSRGSPRIYLYKDASDAEVHFPALYELGPLPRSIPYAVFEVGLPPSFEVHGDIEYSGSVFVTKPIPPGCLRLVSTHSEDYTEFKGVDWDREKGVV